MWEMELKVQNTMEPECGTFLNRRKRMQAY